MIKTFLRPALKGSYADSTQISEHSSSLCSLLLRMEDSEYLYLRTSQN